MKKIIKITIEYEDNSKQIVEDDMARLLQSRINSSGILAGVELKDEE